MKTIQMLEDMLRSRIIDFGGSWDKHLHLAKFPDNNNHHYNIKMAPFEAMYGRKWTTPVCWYIVGERRLTGLEFI